MVPSESELYFVTFLVDFRNCQIICLILFLFHRRSKSHRRDPRDVSNGAKQASQIADALIVLEFLDKLRWA
jgi:hypothetical protein